MSGSRATAITGAAGGRIGRAIGNLMTALRNRIAHEGWNEDLLEEVIDILDGRPSGSSESRDAKEKTIEALPPFDHAFIDVHHGGIDFVPVHRLGELQPGGTML